MAERRASRAAVTPATVVGIAASGGSVEALHALFEPVPVDSGLAFIVVPRLDAAELRRLAALLEHLGTLSVGAIDHSPLEPNHVYVAPAARMVTVEHRRLQLHDAPDRRTQEAAADRFFRSLAADQGARAAAVVLSGTGTVGAVGVRAIKAAGGLSIAQAPGSAVHSTMAAAAIAAGDFDLVLKPGDMPAALLAHATSRAARRAATAMTEHELLLGVTGFFHDPVVSSELPRIIASLIESRGPQHEIPVWVPACATGEEAYSIAMVIAEQLQAGPPGRAHIFATDVDESMLATARAGSYPDGIVLDVSPERLERFFTRGRDHYTVAPWLRDWITFGVHDTRTEAPLSQLDVVCGRSVLTRLQPGQRARMTAQLNSALAPGGYLLLDRAAAPRRRQQATRPPARDLVSQNQELLLLNAQLLSSLKEQRQAGRALFAAHHQVTIQLRRMTRLHALSTTLAGALEQTDLLDAIVRATIEITGADTCSMYLGDDAGVLHPVAQAGLTHGPAVAHDSLESPLVRAHAAVRERGQRVVFGKGFAPGVGAAQATPLFDRRGLCAGLFTTGYREPHEFTANELGWLDLLTQHAADLLRRHETEALLRRATENLEVRVHERTKWLALMHAVTRAINESSTWQHGLSLALQRICEAGQWQIGFVYLPERDDASVITTKFSWFREERLRPFHALTGRCRFHRGQTLPGRVYADGAAIWATTQDDLLGLLERRAEAARSAGLQTAVALPVRVGREVLAVMELFSDEVRPLNVILVNLMHDISAQIAAVLAHERAIAEAADLGVRVQQDLLHTLHDSLGQTLTGLALLASGLQRRTADAATVAAAAQLTGQAQLALAQVRQLSRSLFPIEIDSGGLGPALRTLGETTEELHHIRVTVNVDTTPVGDDHAAAQLYRIAQEGVTNAVKHARPRTVGIEFRKSAGALRLRVVDDGIGIAPAESPRGGLGLRIMRHRAASIGASLSIGQRPGGGTVVTCSLGGRPRRRSGHGVTR